MWVNHAECRRSESPQAVPARRQPKNAAKVPSRRRRDIPEPRPAPGPPDLGPEAGVLLPKALWLQRFGTAETLPRYQSWVAEGPGGRRPVPGTAGPERGRPEAVSGGPLRGAREAEGDRTREAPEGVDLRRWRRGGNDLRRRAPGEGDRREGRGRLDKGGTRKDGPVAAAPRRDDLRWRGRRNGASGVGDP